MDNYMPAGQPCKEAYAKADRPGANDKDPVAGGDGAASDGVGTNRKKLDAGTLVSRKTRRRQQIVCGNRKKFGHAAILMDAKDGDTDATIGLA